MSILSVTKSIPPNNILSDPNQSTNSSFLNNALSRIGHDGIATIINKTKETLQGLTNYSSTTQSPNNTSIKNLIFANNTETANTTETYSTLENKNSSIANLREASSTLTSYILSVMPTLTSNKALPLQAQSSDASNNHTSLFDFRPILKQYGITTMAIATALLVPITIIATIIYCCKKLPTKKTKANIANRTNRANRANRANIETDKSHPVKEKLLMSTV